MSAAEAHAELRIPFDTSHREWATLSARAPQLVATMRRYLVQLTTFLAPLVLHGEHVQRAPLHVAEDLRANIPASMLVVLSGVGHVSNVEAADQFNDGVRDFLHLHQR